MRIAQTLAALLLAALATIMLAAPAAAGSSASCSENPYTAWDYWRFEPSTGGCSYTPGDAFMGQDETLLFINDAGYAHEFEIYVSSETQGEIPVDATCQGADCGTVEDRRPNANVACRGICSMIYSFTLNNEPVTIEMDVDIRAQRFDAVATYGNAGPRMIGVTSEASLADPNQGIWEVIFSLDDATTNPFMTPHVEVFGGTLLNSYWQTDRVLFTEVQAEPGTVFVTLPEGAVATRENTRNESETAKFEAAAAAPMVELGLLSQAQGQNTISARYNARSDAYHAGIAPQIEGPAGQVQDMVDPFGGAVHIPLTAPGRITLTLPAGFYKDAYNYGSEIQGPVSIDAIYGIELQSLTAPQAAHSGEAITLTAQATKAESQGRVRFLARNDLLGTAPLVDGTATLEVTMREENTAFTASIEEVFGFVQHGSSAVAEVAFKKKALEISLDAPEGLTLGEEAIIGIAVSDAEYSGSLKFSTSNEGEGQTLHAGARQVIYTPTRAGSVEFRLSASGDARFEEAIAQPVQRNVAKRGVSLALTATPAEAHPGDWVSLSVTASEAGIETGRLIALVNGKIFHDGQVTGARQVQIPHQVAQNGVMAYEVRFTGSTTHEDALSNSVAVDVVQVEGALSLSANTNAVKVGEIVEITASAPHEHDGMLRILRDGQVVAEHAAGQPGPHYSFTASEPGSIALSAEVIGGTRYADLRSGSLHIDVAAKSTSLALDAKPSDLAPGDETLITATLAPAGAQGLVIFTKDGKDFAVRTIDTQGRASLPFTAGETSATFAARFSPETAEYESATAAPIKIVVSRAETALTLNSEKTEVAPGDEFTLTAEFSQVPADGILSVLAGGQEIKRIEVDGRDSYSITMRASEAGEISYEVAFSDSARFAAAHSNKITITTERVTSAIALDLDAAQAHPGAQVLATVMLDPGPIGGKVTLTLNGEVVSSHPAAAMSRFAFEAPAPGHHEVKAHFTGDERNASATSAPGMLTVAKSEVTLSLTANKEEPVSGEVVTLVATLDRADAKGSIVFMKGEEEIGRGEIAHESASINWQATTGIARLHAIYEGDAAHHSASSKTLVLSVEANTEEAFEEKAPLIHKAVEAETRRAAQARLRHHEWMMRDARTRLRGQGAVVSRNFMPLSYTGMLKADDDRAFAKGSFYGGGDMGGYRRYVYGAFDIAREEGYGTTLEFNGAVAWEKTFGTDMLAGIYLGAELGRTALSNGFDGQIDTKGINAGIYGAKHLDGEVVIDGFANIARLDHDITLSDEDISAKGSYASTALQFGGAITGEHRFRSFSLAPQLAAVHSLNWAEDAQMTAEGASGSSEVILEGGSSRSTRLSATPEMIIPLGERGLAEVSFAPRAICQIEKSDSTTKGCGAGLGLGFDRGFAGGLGHFSADLEVEEISGRRREMLRLDVTLDF